MPAITTKDTRILNARQFVESLSEAERTSMYVFLGKPTPWYNEIAPGSAKDTYREQVDTWDDMQILKMVRDTDITHAVARYNWKAGNVYYQYNDNVPANSLFDSQYVVMNYQYNVYKCLSNGGGNAAINEPVGNGSIGTNLIINRGIGQDGYVWKYMYNIPPGSWVKFGTTAFIPVMTLTNEVKTDAANTRGIFAYNIEQANVGGPSPTGVVALTVVGDGSGATASARIVNGNVANVIVNTFGNNYTVANVITSLGNAVVSPIVAPGEGHGYDSVSECGGFYTMINIRFDQSDAPLLPEEGFKFRQVGLLKDPYLYGTELVPTMTSANLLLTAFSNLTITGALTNGAQLVSGATLTGQTTGANATVVSYTGNVVNYVKSRFSSGNVEANFKPFQVGETIYVKTFAIGTINQLSNATVHPKSGEIIYVDNRNVITRATDQVEDLYIVLEF